MRKPTDLIGRFDEGTPVADAIAITLLCVEHLHLRQ
jgi:hypothetical protein